MSKMSKVLQGFKNIATRLFGGLSDLIQNKRPARFEHCQEALLARNPF